MRFRRAILTAPLVGGLVAVTLAAAGPASADPPYDVAVGGDSSVTDHPFTGTASPIDFIAHGSSGDIPMDCQQSVATGDIHAGTGKSGLVPDHAATIESSTWTTCTGPAGLQMTVEHRGTWKLEVTHDGTTPPPPADTMVTGRIIDVEAYVYATNDEAGCNFTVTGGVNGHFNEVTQELVVDEDASAGVPPGLTILAPQGPTCFGLINDGDTASFFGSYAVDTHGAGPVDIAPSA